MDTNRHFFLRLTGHVLVLLTLCFGSFFIPVLWLAWALFILSSTSIFYHLMMMVLYLRIVMKKRSYRVIESFGENVLIVVPHQDDCVAAGGGYAIQTLDKGGRVDILYITDGYSNDKTTRKREAFDAWEVVGLNKERLHFLTYDNFTDLLDRPSIEKCMEAVRRHIKKLTPDTLIVPLYEGGHYQHDVTNYMVSEIVKKDGLKLTVYEAPLYNFYFSLGATPEKILSGLCRLIPFINYHYPPEPIRKNNIYALNMKKEKRVLKNKMLSKFITQSPEKLIERLGFEDRFQKMHPYDYSRPPFDYQRSLARRVHDLKRLPLIGKIASRTMIWTKTIHPDPEYTMTRIPL